MQLECLSAKCQAVESHRVAFVLTDAIVLFLGWVAYDCIQSRAY
jgi:hypothetical protein